MARKKTYVLDTSVYLTDFNSVYAFKNNDIVVPLKVLEEIDKHKKRQDAVGSNARRTIKILDDLRSKGSLEKGVRIAKGRGILTVKGYNSELLPEEFPREEKDRMLYHKRRYQGGRFWLVGLGVSPVVQELAGDY